jgi:hypothetical protein
METTKIYTFKLNNGKEIIVDAISEESARRKLIRRRNDYRTSYSGAYNATLLKVEETSDQKILNKLYKGLKRETKTFKKTYLERTKNYIVEHFNHVIDTHKDFDNKKWLEVYGSNVKSGRYSYRVITPQGRKLRQQFTDFIKINETKTEYNRYVKEEVKKYSNDFDNKLIKLASRLEGKGFNTKIKVTSEHVGVNFNCWVTDGTNSVQAYTIIAEGPIQRPHYRYLIK